MKYLDPFANLIAKARGSMVMAYSDIARCAQAAK